jgi:hypothetical protein
VDEAKLFTDTPFIKKGELQPNIRYKTGEFDYFYETDDLGRISKCETEKLQPTNRGKGERLDHDPNTPGKLEGDHAGHLFADRFGGSPEIDNLVSQLSGVNLSSYKTIENKWAKALKKTPPETVTVNIEIIYENDSLRPSKFNIEYTINGKPFSQIIKNS